MKVLLVEDEIPASNRLIALIKEQEPTWEIVAVKDEILNTVEWLKSNPAPDLIFMDIHLADGFSFAIFDEVEITSKVVFVTAYDQYALKAFDVNGLDYLLKPIKVQELARSIARFKEHILPHDLDISKISALFKEKERPFKERFLVKSGEDFNFVRVNEVAHIISEASYSFLVTKSGNRYILDRTLEQIEGDLNPDSFFRINRKQIIGIESIQKIAPYLNNRLRIELNPPEKEDSIVSRNRVALFKSWLDR